MTNIAIEVENRCKNTVPVHLGYGQKDNRIRAEMTHGYPRGQVYRGIFGYFFMEMDSPLKDSFHDGKPVIYFKDGFAEHGQDGGMLYPLVVKNRFVDYECQKCKKMLRSPTFIGVVTRTRISRTYGGVSQMFRIECITGSHTFRFKAIYNLKVNEDNAGDFLGLLEFLEEDGLRIGKGGKKGYGRLEFPDEFQIRVIKLADIEKRAKQLANKKRITIRLLSDTTINNGVRDIIDVRTFITSVKKAGKFFNPEYRSYEDPKARLISHVSMRPYEISFLDAGNITRASAVPAGSSFTYEVDGAPRDFYLNLAIAERCSGIGNRTSFGKGEFIIN